MTDEKNASLCAYCGEAEASTVDHIPPKLFLAQPYPDNLLTVPACGRCNRSFQADDEYTRFVASIDLRADKHPDVQRKRPALMRSIQRPQSAGFTQYLLGQMGPSTILDWAGNPLGQRVEVDSVRVNASGEHLVRGLFFHETGRVLDSSLTVRVASKAGVVASDPAVLDFARIYQSWPDRRSGAVGNAFSYVAAFYSQHSIWLLLLYEYFGWLGLTQPKETNATK